MTKTSDRTPGMKELGKLLSHCAPPGAGAAGHRHRRQWLNAGRSTDRTGPRSRFKVDCAVLERVAAENHKQRFTLCADGQRIRAAQGHLIAIDLGLSRSKPPEIVFHGTARHNLGEIFAKGLEVGRRRHVHLSLSQETASTVGGRHGTLVVLRFDARRMHADGIAFWQADNGGGSRSTSHPHTSVSKPTDHLWTAADFLGACPRRS